MVLYGMFNDAEFTTHRVINMLDDGPFKELDDYRWLCSQSKDSEYFSERNDMVSNLEITSSNVDKIERIAELTFKLPLESGYFKIPPDKADENYVVYTSWGVFPSASDTNMKLVRGEQ